MEESTLTLVPRMQYTYMQCALSMCVLPLHDTCMLGCVPHHEQTYPKHQHKQNYVEHVSHVYGKRQLSSVGGSSQLNKLRHGIIDVIPT